MPKPKNPPPRIDVDGKQATAMEVAQKAVEERGSDLTGQVFIVTGANRGLGFEAARALVSQCATVILACRDRQLMDESVTNLNGEFPPHEGQQPYVQGMELDLSDLDSIRSFAKEFNARGLPLHCLINNVGVGMNQHGKSSKQGFQLLWGVNVLGTFLLTYLLLDKLKSSNPSRIVFVSSTASEKGHFGGRGFDPLAESTVGQADAYRNSKFAVNLLCRKLHRMLQASGVSTYALHPGVVGTKMNEDTVPACLWCCVFRLQMFGTVKSTEQGAATTVYCATVPSVAEDSGEYFMDCQVVKPRMKCPPDNEELQDTLWTMCEEYCGLCEPPITTES